MLSTLISLCLLLCHLHLQPVYITQTHTARCKSAHTRYHARLATMDTCFCTCAHHTHRNRTQNSMNINMISLYSLYTHVSCMYRFAQHDRDTRNNSSSQLICCLHRTHTYTNIMQIIIDIYLHLLSMSSLLPADYTCHEHMLVAKAALARSSSPVPCWYRHPHRHTGIDMVRFAYLKTTCC